MASAGAPPSGEEQKVAIVTGANAGIGKSTAAELVKRGFTVVLGCRNIEAAVEAAREIQLPPGDARNGSAEVLGKLDLADPATIRSFVAAFNKAHERLDVLVNNAGCNYIPTWHTEAGVVGIVQVNYLGPFYLTRLLEGKLQRCHARVVNVSSSMHRWARIPDVQAFLTSPTHGKYSTTKLANVFFTQQLLTRSRGRIKASSVDPGAVNTGIFRRSALAAPVARTMGNLGLFSGPEDGCQAVVHACTAPWPILASAFKVAEPDCGAGGCQDQAATPSTGTGQEPAACSRPEHASAVPAPFYARGLFAGTPLVLWGRTGTVENIIRSVYIFTACGFLDQLLRKLLRGGFGTGTTFSVAANCDTLNQITGNSLWDTSSHLVGLSSELAATKP